MNELENAVASAVSAGEMPADNAQASVTETSIGEVTLEELMQQSDAQEQVEQTAETEGDSGPVEEQVREADGKKDKFEARIRAALESQRKGFAKDVDFASGVRRIAQGMSDSEVLEALREHQARKMHEADPDISEKAAKQIIEEREKAKPESPNVEAYRQGVQSLIEDGWTREELAAFAADNTVREELAEGVSLRKAAKSFLVRANKANSEAAPRRRAVPTSRNTAAGTGEQEDPIASMSDAEFEKFSKRARQAMLEGKRIRF